MLPLNWTTSSREMVAKIDKWGAAEREDPSETTRRLLDIANGGGNSKDAKKTHAQAEKDGDLYANLNATEYEKRNTSGARYSRSGGDPKKARQSSHRNASASSGPKGRRRRPGDNTAEEELDTPLQRKLRRFDAAQKLLEAPPRHARAAKEWRQGKDRLLGVEGYMNSRLTRTLDEKK